ncbi:MAG: hypothetical protein OXU64_07710 [Gemmatimonadota bacterium]|nr:hypothetical protein [Gemmatimonadota bacterium]
MRRILIAVGAAVIGAAIATAPRVLEGTIVGRWLGITEPEASPGNADPPASGSLKRAGNRTANLYVILLRDEVRRSRKFRKRNPHYRPSRIRFLRKPCVYVGQTARDPEERFEQHKNGIKASRIARKYGVCLLPRLYEHLNPVPAADREEQERRLALHLQKRGYGVWWN